MSRADDAARYERTDADARKLVLAGAVLALVLAASLGASFWVTRGAAAELAAEEQPSPVRDLRAPAEGLELLVVPARELERQRAWEEELLTSAAWIDPVNGIVRIPIERAIELSLREGFPTREGRR